MKRVFLLSAVALVYSADGFVAPQCGCKASGVTMMAGKSAAKAKKGFAPRPASGGFGAKPGAAAAVKKSSAPAYDGPASLRANEAAYDLYDAQAAADPDELHFREYIVSARLKEGCYSSAYQLADWVPVAQLGLLSSATNPLDQMVPVTHALATLCREVTTAATLAVPSMLLRVPHAHLEYAVEPTESWIKWVYETVIEEKSAAKASSHAMSRADAWEILGLENTATAGEIKRAYLKLARDLHPDALIGREADEIAAAEARFRQVSQAHELLSASADSGKRVSWYESLGGKSRTEFFPVDLTGQQLGAQRLANVMEFATGGWRAAVRGLDSDVVQTFASRNAAAARTAP